MAFAQSPPPRYKKRRVHSDTSKLAILCLFSFIALGAFAAYKMVPSGDFSLVQFFSNFEETDDNAVRLGNVKLGSTIDIVQKNQPSAIQRTTSSGAVTLGFAEKGAAYMVWYSKRGSEQVAYKARQSRTLNGISEDEFVGQLSLKYGTPSLSSCSRRITDGIRDCHFSWWVANDIRIDLDSRQYTSPTPRLKTTMQITNTRMDLRLQRLSQR